MSFDFNRCRVGIKVRCRCVLCNSRSAPKSHPAAQSPPKSTLELLTPPRTLFSLCLYPPMRGSSEIAVSPGISLGIRGGNIFECNCRSAGSELVSSPSSPAMPPTIPIAPCHRDCVSYVRNSPISLSAFIATLTIGTISASTDSYHAIHAPAEIAKGG